MVVVFLGGIRDAAAAAALLMELAGQGWSERREGERRAGSGLRGTPREGGARDGDRSVEQEDKRKCARAYQLPIQLSLMKTILKIGR